MRVNAQWQLSELASVQLQYNDLTQRILCTLCTYTCSDDATVIESHGHGFYTGEETPKAFIVILI